MRIYDELCKLYLICPRTKLPGANRSGARLSTSYLPFGFQMRRRTAVCAVDEPLGGGGDDIIAGCAEDVFVRHVLIRLVRLSFPFQANLTDTRRLSISPIRPRNQQTNQLEHVKHVTRLSSLSSPLAKPLRRQPRRRLSSPRIHIQPSTASRHGNLYPCRPSQCRAPPRRTHPPC